MVKVGVFLRRYDFSFRSMLDLCMYVIWKFECVNVDVLGLF
jgi:hypothetical protein